jgi:hypothetical protein
MVKKKSSKKSSWAPVGYTTRASTNGVGKQKGRRRGPPGGRPNPGVTKARNNAQAAPNRNPTATLTSLLTEQESAIANYLAALSVPGYPGRVPLSMGDFELITNTYEYVFNGACSAGANGLAYAAAVPDGWLESGNDAGPAQQYLSYAAGTQGYPVWQSGANASQTPVNTGASGANDFKFAFPVGGLDPGFDNVIQYRLVALILEAWPDGAAQTTQGDLTIAAIATEEALQDGALNAVNFSTVAAYPREYVNHLELPLSNWPSGHVASINMVPYGQSCVNMNSCPAVGLATAGLFGAAVIGNGMASGQTIRYRFTYKYETTAPRTYQTNTISTSTSMVETTSLAPHIKAMKGVAAAVGPREHQAAKAMVAIKQANPTMGNKLLKVAKSTGLGKLVSAGLKHVPYIGSLLSSAADWFLG